MKKPRLAFIAGSSDGAGRVRSYWPAEALEARGWDIVHAAPSYPLATEFDVAIIHRPMDPEHADHIDGYLSPKRTVLVQEDDDLWGWLDTRHFGVGQLDEPGEMAEHRAMVELHDQVLGRVDGLIVTTDHLLKVYGSMAPRIWRVDNYLPEWISTVRAFGRGYEPGIRVGYAGVMDVHGHDLAWLRPAAPAAFDGASFTTVGDHRTPRYLKPECPLEVWPYEGDARAFYKRMARAHIGIVPLEPTSALNTGKSWLKALEYSMLGCPVVVTRTAEQAEFVQHGVTGFLADDPDTFAGYVQQLVHDDRLRVDMGAAARRRAVDAFTIEDNVHRWEAVLRDVTA